MHYVTVYLAIVWGYATSAVILALWLASGYTHQVVALVTDDATRFPAFALLLGTFFTFLPFYPLIYACNVQTKAKTFDNKHPRLQKTELMGWAHRCKSAHENGCEDWPKFAVALLCALHFGVEADVVNAVATLYLAMRFVFIGFYVFNLDILRSNAFVTALTCTYALLYFSWKGNEAAHSLTSFGADLLARFSSTQ